MLQRPIALSASAAAACACAATSSEAPLATPSEARICGSCAGAKGAVSAGAGVELSAIVEGNVSGSAAIGTGLPVGATVMVIVLVAADGVAVTVKPLADAASLAAAKEGKE